MNVSTIVFDFGNVIGHFDHRLAAQKLAAFTDLSAEQIHQFMLESAELEEEYESGRLSTNDFLARLRRELRLIGEDAHLSLAFADMFTPNDEVCALIPLLAEKVRLVLLSNTNDLHFRHFREQFRDVLDRFHVLVASHQVGLRKPNPRIYRCVEDLADVRGAECVFVDDLPANVEAARACGWRGIVYRPNNDLVGQLRAAGVTLPTSS